MVKAAAVGTVAAISAVRVVDETSAFVTALAALVIGATYLGRRMLRAAKKIEALSDLATRELNHNGGSSMKDAVAEVRATQADMVKRVARIESALNIPPEPPN